MGDNDDISALPADLQDELISINAIYGASTLSISQPSGNASEDITLLLSPPSSHPLYPTTLHLAFPPDYPVRPAHVTGLASIDPTAAKGAGHALVHVARQALASACVPGEPCVFALLAELESVLGSSEETCEHASTTDQSSSQDAQIADADAAAAPKTSVSLTALAWTIAPSLESHKSVFIARAVRVHTPADVLAATSALLESDRHVARATHNIRAWRLRGGAPSSGDDSRLIEHQECDDDGESRAGARVLAVMTAMDAWNVLVIVSRWYGGVKLGPERFRLIGQCARDVLVLWTHDAAEREGNAVKSDKKKKINKGKA